MIRLEISCDHATEPRARDVKNPCESTRNRSLAVDVAGTIDDAKREVDRQVEARGWKRWVMPAWGRKKGYLCGPCYARARGTI